MSFTGESLLRRLADLEPQAGIPSRYIVAFSGGLDSTALLHALAGARQSHGKPILAVYVDHGLQRDSVDWGERCKQIAAGLGVEFSSRRVAVDLGSGLGLEAAARQARYSALRSLLEPGDWLMSAHHRDDQAETVLLNMMRGSGTSGLAGIAPARRLAGGWLVRPLLDVPRSELEAYAEEHPRECLLRRELSAGTVLPDYAHDIEVALDAQDPARIDALTETDESQPGD
mgnify:CR=1 FL=1